jgi:hypothetical protein
VLAGAKLYELKPRGLEGRFFGGVSRGGAHHNAKDSDQSPSSGHQSGSDAKGKSRQDGDEREARGEGHSSMSSASSDGEMQAVVGEGMMFQEDNFLTSANLCRWVIDFNEIALGKQVHATAPPTHQPQPKPPQQRKQHALT